MATHRSNFILMHALPVADWIDWLGGARDIPEDVKPLPFMRFGYAGRSFLASINSLLPYDPFYWRLEGLPDIAFRHPSRWRHWPDDAPRLDWFVMEEKAATAFLDGLSGRIPYSRRKARILHTRNSQGLERETGRIESDSSVPGRFSWPPTEHASKPLH